MQYGWLPIFGFLPKISGSTGTARMHPVEDEVKPNIGGYIFFMEIGSLESEAYNARH